MKSKNKTKIQKDWEKKNSEGKATLSWNMTDYEVWNIKPPECLMKDTLLTEGEQMSDNDIEYWFTNSTKTLKILRETEPKVFERLYKGLILDIKYLISIKRLDKSGIDFVLDKNNFQF